VDADLIPAGRIFYKSDSLFDMDMSDTQRPGNIKFNFLFQGIDPGIRAILYIENRDSFLSGIYIPGHESEHEEIYSYSDEIKNSNLNADRFPPRRIRNYR